VAFHTLSAGSYRLDIGMSSRGFNIRPGGMNINGPNNKYAGYRDGDEKVVKFHSVISRAEGRILNLHMERS